MSSTWLIFGSITVWLTLLAPSVTLLSWLLQFDSLPWLGAGLLASPLVLRALVRSLRGGSRRVRWWWLQSLGAGALLMLLIPPGWLMTFRIPPARVGILVIVAWCALIWHAARRATRIYEQRLTLEAPALKQATRLVQISDVHIGSRSSGFLSKVVEQIKRHEPDIVVITGDLLDAEDVGEQQLAALATLSCPTLMCIGNHERYVPVDRAVAAIRAQGVSVLRDSSVRIGPLHFIGVDDRDRPDALPTVLAALIDTPALGSNAPIESTSQPRSGRRTGENPTAGSQRKRFPVGDYKVLLYHRPDGWLAARAAGIQLTLSGHTHGGQIWPFGLLVRRQYPLTCGHFIHENTSMYVSPGTGTWGPTLRFGTRSEMTIIDLEPQSC